MSIEILEIFKATEKQSHFHSLDPRVKLYFIVCTMILVFLINYLIFQIIYFVFLLILVNLAKTIEYVSKSIRAFGSIIFFIILINTMMYKDGFNFSLIISLRVLNIIIAIGLFFQTTTPDELSQAIQKLGMPYNFAFTIALAFRFLPTLAYEAELITDAQRSRGLKIENKGMMDTIKNLFSLLIPLISNSIQRAFYIAESLETRSFITDCKRTYLFEIKMKKVDYIYLIIISLLTFFGLYLRYNAGVLPYWFFFALPL